MKKNNIRLVLMLPFFGLAASCSKETSTPVPTPATVIEGAGNIRQKIDSFRHLLGDQLNTTINVTGGRREINWDGVPDTMLGKDLPKDFFNPTAPGSPEARQRGFTYAATGQFRVSNNNFQDINSNAAGGFQPFSGNKTFANISSNAWEIEVQKPGQNITAASRGFGMVFSDVDLPNSTSLEFFDGTKSLGKFFAPTQKAGSSFSFLGVYFNTGDRITRIRVQHDGVLSDGEKDISDSGTKDLVVLDDILYSEPVVR